MKEQLYLRSSTGVVFKINQYRPGPLPETIEVEHRKRWYSMPWDVAIYKFDPNTLTVTCIEPAKSVI